jgi:hypothetical protein
MDLEFNHGLKNEFPAHIWLIHRLFLNPINADIMDWANSWNNHKMTISGLPRGHARKSPHDQRWFSMLENGARGFEPEDEHLDADEIDEYGIDWDAYDDPMILNHHDSANPVDPLAHNPFVAHEPEEFSIVEVDEPGCLLSASQLDQLNLRLAQIPFGRTIHDHRKLWIEAFALCVQLMQ